MEQKKRKRSIPFADLPMLWKFAAVLLLLAAAVSLLWLSMLQTLTVTQKERYQQMEGTAITAAEQVMNLSVETAVSIAKNIYTNDAIYEFLNKKYETSAAYYETYYPLQQNTVMNLADTNIIRSCTIYTENPTVLAGGSIKKLNRDEPEYWYQSFQKMGKPTILCINPDSASLVLVRKLDYRSLETGESYLCLELNNLILPQFVENLGFDGELYVLSGNNLLYSSAQEATTTGDIRITPEYACLIRNYYTVDIEFYSRAVRHGFADFLMDNRWLLIGFGVVLGLIAAVSFMIFFDMKKRIRPLLSEELHMPEKRENGRDEIGRLLDRFTELTELAGKEGGESAQSKENAARQTAEYDQLFRTAMRLDSELVVGERLPDMKTEEHAEEIPLAEEAKVLKKLASKLSAQFSSDELPPDKWMVPAYSLVLIADDILRRFIEPSVCITVSGDTASITFESPVQPKSTDSLKLRAIFEDSKVSEAYDFNRNYRFNPYMRLKACLGDSTDIELTDKNLFRLVIKVTQQGGSP